MNKIYLAVLLFLVSVQAHAQTVFWSDNFESANAAAGRTPSYEGRSGGPPSTRYFARIGVGDVHFISPYSGINGQFWGAEDVDAVPSGVSNEQSSEQHVTWSNINIAGKQNLSFRGKFATTLTTVWDHGTITTVPDYCVMQYQLNGTGAWVPFLSFRPNMLNGGNGALAIDNNNDGLGDGISLTAAFTEFRVTLGVTGNTISLRCASSINALQEELGFDDFQLFSGSPLPVSLTSLTATVSASGNELKWTTTNERNHKNFEIERSEDGRNFKLLDSISGNVPSSEARSYNWVDRYPRAATNYYRLKQNDFGGDFTYSQTVSIRNDKDIHVSVYPNPTKYFISVIMPDNLTIASKWEIVDVQGRLMTFQMTKNGDTYKCDIHDFPSGIYYLRTAYNNGEVLTSKFFKD